MPLAFFSILAKKTGSMIVFTRHAKNRMRRDKGAEADAEDCVHAPDFERQQDAGKREVWKSYQGRYLKVVCREEGTERVIITVTEKKKRPTWATH